MTKKRLANLLDYPQKFEGWKGNAIYVGLFKFHLTSGVEYLCLFMDLKTGSIYKYYTSPIQFNGSMIAAFLLVIINEFPIDLPNTIIHTHAGHPFDAKVFLSVLKSMRLRGSTFLRTEFIPFYIKFMIFAVAEASTKFDSAKDFIKFWNIKIKNIEVSPDGRNVKDLPGFPGISSTELAESTYTEAESSTTTKSDLISTPLEVNSKDNDDPSTTT
jgi:hypothetical protein